MPDKETEILVKTKTISSVSVAASLMLATSSVALFVSWAMLAIVAMQSLSPANEPASGGGGAIVSEQPNPKNHGPQKFIVISVYPPHLTPLTHSKQRVLDWVAKGENSVAGFWNQNSYGQMTMVGLDGASLNEDDVFGPYVISLDPNAPANMVDREIDFAAVAAASVADPTFFSKLFDGLRVIVLTNSSCGAGGTAFNHNYGTEASPKWVYFALVCVVGQGTSFGTGVDFKDTVHEVGHTFGVGHARYNRCAPDLSRTVEDCDNSGFTDWDHSHPYDVMGRGWWRSQSAAGVLVRASWLLENPQAAYRVETVFRETLPPDATYHLSSISSASPGLKAIRIPHGYTPREPDGPDPREYLYVEWHTPQGLDAAIPTDQSNIFSGALLTVTQFISPTLIHAVAISDAIGCKGFTKEECPRALQTALPFGQSYTDPNSGTTIAIGPQPPPGGELAVTVTNLGRTDFEPPKNLQLRELDSPDACTARYQANVEDAGSGVSKIVFYYRKSSENDDQAQTSDFFSASAEISLDLQTYRNGAIWFRAYDMASLQGGRVPDASSDSIKIYVPRATDCDTSGPTVTLQIPEAGFVVTQNNKFVNVDSPISVHSPVMFKVTVADASFLRIVDLSEFGINDNCKQNLCPIFSDYLQFLNIKEYATEKLAKMKEGTHHLTLFANDALNQITGIDFFVNILPASPFTRGEVDGDGVLKITDAIQILDYLFLGNIKDISCKDAADVNDNGIVNIADAQYLLGYMFAGTNPEPKAPFSACGVDPTPDDNLGCASFPQCQ